MSAASGIRTDAGAWRRQPARTIYAKLRHDISVGELAEGTPLVETRLAERYAVSRTPIRQALLALEQDGLVARDGRSLHVRRQSTAEIVELYDVREVLEERAARLAARRHDESDALVLNRMLERMSGDLSDGDRYAINREFHTSMWRAAHHAVLMQTLERLYVSSVQALSTTLTSGDRWAQAVEEHRGMVEAVVRGDEDKAAEIVLKHLRTARDIRLAAILDRS